MGTSTTLHNDIAHAGAKAQICVETHVPEFVDTAVVSQEKYQTLSTTHMRSCDFIKGEKADVLPRIGTMVIVAILAQGTNWADAVRQAFFENGRRQFVILHH